MSFRLGVVGVVVALLCSDVFWGAHAQAQEAQPIVLVPPSAQVGPADAGWAFSAGVLGVVSAAGVVGLSIGSAATDGDPASAYFGLAATGLLALSAPIVAVGGASARTNPLIQGSSTVRTFGWIGYGLSLTSAVSLMFVGVADKDVPIGLIAATGILGAGSLVAFAVDAFNSDADARSPVGQARTSSQSFALRAPTFLVVPRREGGVDGVLSIGGIF